VREQGTWPQLRAGRSGNTTRHGWDGGPGGSENHDHRDTDVPLRGTATAARSHPAPLVVPTSRVNVALPFSKITIEEPAKEFTELAAIVAVAATSLSRADQGP